MSAASRIEDLRRRYGITLPQDFETYLLQAAPVEDWWDDHGIVWWGLDRLKSLADECPDPTPPRQVNAAIEAEPGNYLMFADYLDWCYAYAICCSDGPNRGRVALVGGEPDGFVADSFSEFAALAEKNSARLHSPSGDAYRVASSAV